MLMSGLRQTHRVRQLADVQAPWQSNLSLLSACDMRNQRRSPRSPGIEERELEGREQGSWGEGANLVILSAAAAAAANSTSSGEVETEQHKITRVMKTSGIAAEGRTWGKNE